jgi:hypothetical protein
MKREEWPVHNPIIGLDPIPARVDVPVDSTPPTSDVLRDAMEKEPSGAPLDTRTSTIDLAGLKGLIEANPSVDWRFVALDGEQTQSTIDLRGLPPNTALRLLRAYQRLVRILPIGEEHHALPLLASGLHSAIQIASIPQRQFERHWAELFPGDEALAVTVYRVALGRRSDLLHRHMNNIQRNEPHYRTARFK